MPSTPPPAETTARARHCARLEAHVEDLAALRGLGMRLATALGERAIAAAEAGDETEGDAGLMFGRVTRAVRLTMALEARLSAEAVAMEEGEGQAEEDADGVFVTHAELEAAGQRARERLQRLAALPPLEDGEEPASEAEAAVRPRRGPREALTDPAEREDREDEDWRDGGRAQTDAAAETRWLQTPEAEFGAEFGAEAEVGAGDEPASRQVPPRAGQRDQAWRGDESRGARWRGPP